jgi:hypothetical protein
MVDEFQTGDGWIGDGLIGDVQTSPESAPVVFYVPTLKLCFDNGRRVFLLDNRRHSFTAEVMRAYLRIDKSRRVFNLDTQRRNLYDI